MKQDRKPEYHKKDKDIRVVSRANGLWTTQRYRERGASQSRKLIDPWKDLFGAHSLSYEQAKARMEAEAND